MAQMVSTTLQAKLDRARGYWRALLAVEGWLWTVAAVLVAFLCCFHADRWLVLSLQGRVTAWCVLAALGLAGTLYLVLRPLIAPRPAEDVAVMVERRFPQLRERLLSAVEFARLPRERLEGVSSTLLGDLQADAEREAAVLNFQAAFDTRGIGRAATSLAVVLLVLGIHVLLAGPAFGAFLSRMALQNTPVWRDTRLRVEPWPEAKALRGQDFLVRATQEGILQKQGRLFFRFGKGRWNRVELKADGKSHFSHRFLALTEDLTFYAAAGDGRSDEATVRVVDPAVIVGGKLRLEYPAYMDRPSVTVDAGSGGVAAPVGTRVSLELKANKPLEQALASVGKAAPAPWSVQGDTVTGSLVVRQSGQYVLNLKDTDGFQAPEPQAFPVKALPDEAPEVQLQAPQGDLDVVPDARVKLAIVARDDYGIAEVRVPYEVTGRSPATLPAGRGDRRAKSLELENLWALGPLKLKPGDVVRYRVEATDWDNLSGPHVGKTSELQLRVIDRGEAERRYEQQQQELQEQLKELIKEQRAARAEVEAQRAAAQPNAEAIAGAEERQRNAAASAADLARRMAEIRRGAETNNLADKAELDAQQGAQQSLERLSREAMPQAANRIGSAQQQQAQSNPQGARQELSGASQQQQQILQELDRLSQAMRPGGELQRLADRFGRLAREQRNLQAQADKLLPQTLGKRPEELTAQERAQLQQLSQQQQSLQRATGQAMQDLDRAAQAMQQRGSEGSESAREASQALQQSQVGERQSQAAQSAQQNALGQARAQQEQAAQALESASEQLRSASNPNDPRQLERQLRQAANQLNRMLQRQNEAVEQSRRLMSPEERKALAQEERDLQQQTRELARQLQRLQRRSPQSGRAAEQLQQAEQSLGQASQSVSQGQQSEGQQQAQRAQQSMRRAMQSLQQAQAEAQSEQEDDPFAELRKTLTALAEKQKGLAQSARTLAAEQQERGPRAEDAEDLKAQARQQADLSGSVEKLEPQLPGDVFRRFSREARGAMERARAGLDQGNPRADPTGKAQARAQTLLEQLARALDADPKDQDDSNGQSGGGGEGEGQGGGKADPELLKRIAEIRLLRTLEQGIRSRTQETDDGRSSQRPLTDAQKEEIAETARQQAEARSLADRLVQGLEKNRQLAGKVGQAGKHMSEAHRGLDQGETGEGVQEQETQAIIRLTDALKQAQQQAQQQRQQQQRRQQQAQQQQQQQQGQQQQGQPQGGTPQQQQGSQAAMQSLQRRANRQDGPLGDFGSGRGGFGLDPRSQDALRQGYKEKIPPEYQELINRYYRGLSSKGR